MRLLICGAVFAFALSACASNDAPAPTTPAPLPRPPVTENATPATPSGPSVAAPGVTLPAERSPARDDDISVPGSTERPVVAPEGDPRTESERIRDIRRWDECVMRAQGAGEGDPTRPQLNSPEELCSRSLGMASRRAVPESRRNRP